MVCWHKSDCLIRGEARHKSSEGDRLGDIVAKLCELDKMIDERVDALVDLRLELESHIEKLEDPLPATCWR